jgi:aerobic carbon-monoxide dehydrogenase small subunit
MMSKTPVQFTLNGTEVAVFVEGGGSLLSALRNGAGDLSPKQGCGQGTCGACTVIVEGQSMLACITLAETCAGKRVETADGLRDGDGFHPLQTMFMDHFAAQCGFCTPGMIMAAKTLLDRNPQPTREEVMEAISGNICRCTGYTSIVDAVMAAAAMRGRRSA